MITLEDNNYFNILHDSNIIYLYIYTTIYLYILYMVYLLHAYNVYPYYYTHNIIYLYSVHVELLTLPAVTIYDDAPPQHHGGPPRSSL